MSFFRYAVEALKDATLGEITTTENVKSVFDYYDQGNLCSPYYNIDFSADFCPWVLQNLDDMALQGFDRGGAPSFGLLLWALWKARIGIVFQGTVFDLQGIDKAALRLQLDYNYCRRALQASSLWRCIATERWRFVGVLLLILG